MDNKTPHLVSPAEIDYSKNLSIKVRIRLNRAYRLSPPMSRLLQYRSVPVFQQEGQ